MDYEALANILPLAPANWNEHHVARWLQFVHLEPLIASFCTYSLMQQSIVSTDHSYSPSLHSTSISWESPIASSSANLCDGLRRVLPSSMLISCLSMITRRMCLPIRTWCLFLGRICKCNASIPLRDKWKQQEGRSQCIIRMRGWWCEAAMEI